MKTKYSLIFFLGLVASLSGCASGRLNDLRDCGGISLGVGIGLGAEAKLGCLTHPSIGVAAYSARVGAENRTTWGTWSEIEMFAPYLNMFLMSGGAHRDEERGVPREAWTTSYLRLVPQDEQQGKWINTLGKTDGITEQPSLFSRATDIELGVMLGIAGARLRVNPLEIVDFTLGILGLDIAKEDL